MILVSSTEPPALRAVGSSSQIPESYGADILFSANGKLVGIQRKTVVDLLASLEDGRLAREVSQLQGVHVAMLIVEGQMSWTTDGMLMESQRAFTRKSMYGLMLSLYFEHRVAVIRTNSLSDTIEVVKEAQSWFAKTTHFSLFTRPKLKGDWGVFTSKDWSRFILQGFPGVGTTLADAIYDHFGRIPLRWDANYLEMLRVPGIGERRAQALWRSLDGSTGTAGTPTEHASGTARQGVRDMAKDATTRARERARQPSNRSKRPPKNRRNP